MGYDITSNITVLNIYFCTSMQLGLSVKQTVVVEKQCINFVFIISFMKIGFARECVKHVYAH